MRRVHDKDINSPEYFDKMWTEGLFGYDTVRLDTLCKYIKSGNYIVELGCGLYGFAQYAKDRLRLDIEAHVVDFSSVALAKIKQVVPSIYTYQCDVRSTKFPPEFFDVVGAGELIEHMEDPKDLVAEMDRICKPGGWIVISTVNTKSENAKKCSYPEHLWAFEENDLIRLFYPYGEVKYSIVGDYHIVETQKYDSRRS